MIYSSLVSRDPENFGLSVLGTVDWGSYPAYDAMMVWFSREAEKFYFADEVEATQHRAWSWFSTVRRMEDLKEVTADEMVQTLRRKHARMSNPRNVSDSVEYMIRRVDQVTRTYFNRTPESRRRVSPSTFPVPAVDEWIGDASQRIHFPEDVRDWTHRVMAASDDVWGRA